MTNRIRQVAVQAVRLEPYECEIGIAVYPERLTSTTEVRGRLVGPRCAYSRTVEVAYPLRPHAGSRERERPDEDTRPDNGPALTYRVVIPEASFWDPETPFLYEGPVELWEEGRAVDRVEVSHGLRTRHVGPQGVRWNGRPLTLRGVTRAGLSAEEAASLRQAGFNTLLAPLHVPQVWETADRLGFLVIGQLTDLTQLEQARLRDRHASSLGWILGGTVPDEFSLQDVLAHLVKL